MAARDWTSDDFSWVRGMNYTPSYAANDVMTWRDFDADVIDRELSYARKLNLNSVRIWLQYIVYEHNPGKFCADFETFLALCAKHGIKAMPALFDSCFGDEPTLDWNGHWVMSPGTSKERSEYWPKLARYVEDVVGKHTGDNRVLMWDIMNEPALSDSTTEFVKHWCTVVRAMDSTHPVTVGVAPNVTMALPFLDDEDVVSMHSYASYAAILRHDIRRTKALGKPVIISEFCVPAWGQSYEMAMPAVYEAGIGWYAWELIIGINQFAPLSGLLYPDGTCRRRSEVAAVMGIPEEDVPFDEKPDSEGVTCKYPEDQPEVLDESFLEKVKALATVKTTPETYDERKERDMPFAMQVCSLVMLTPEEEPVFQAYTELLAPGDNPDKVSGAKALDTLFAAMARHADDIDLDELNG